MWQGRPPTNISSFPSGTYPKHAWYTRKEYGFLDNFRLSNWLLLVFSPLPSHRVIPSLVPSPSDPPNNGTPSSPLCKSSDTFVHYLRYDMSSSLPSPWISNVFSVTTPTSCLLPSKLSSSLSTTEIADCGTPSAAISHHRLLDIAYCTVRTESASPPSSEPQKMKKLSVLFAAALHSSIFSTTAAPLATL